MKPLSALWMLPAAFGLLAAMAGALGAAWPRRAARFGALAVLAYALWLSVPYSAADGAWRLYEMGDAASFGLRYALGLDGIALSLVWLNALLTFLALATTRGQKPAGYWASFLFLEAAVMGVFLARDLFLFYVFWEIGLIPMFLIIGLWGGEGRRKAAIKFLLYTALGSLFMLFGFLALVWRHHAVSGEWSWLIAELASSAAGMPGGLWIYLAIALGFAVKIPMFPLHSWLPDAHTEAPAAGSVMLAGVLLKMGVYGFLRVLLPVFPELSQQLAAPFGALAVISILYGALCAAPQPDLKRLIAFTSISHLGFCMLGLFSLTPQGAAGGSLQLLNHGLSTGALFLMIGMIYERSHKRGVHDFGGLARRAPWLTFFFGLTMFASIGLPGLNGFVGETLALAGMAAADLRLAAAALLGVALSAYYFLPAFAKVFWAPEGPHSCSSKIHDLDWSEKSALGALAALMVAIGVYPAPLLRLIEPAIAELLR